MKQIKYALIICVVTLVMAACGSMQGDEPTASDPQPITITRQPTADPDQPVSSDDPTPTPVPMPENAVIGQAMVDKIDILIMESFPLQVSVHVAGNLPDGCTSIGQVTSQRVDNTFQVTIETVRPTGVACTEALVPYEENVPLDVYGLPAGTYTVDVNGVAGTFTFETDNILPDSAENMGDSLSPADKAELVKLTLERALIAQEIPDYGLWAEQGKFVLSLQNYST